MSSDDGGGGKHYVVLVLGDVGRSPRMQYHTVSLAALPGSRVSLVGYTGEDCVADVEQNPRITKHLISPLKRRPWMPFLIFGPLKVLAQIFQMLWVLCVKLPAPTALLVQNPPAIPALMVVWLVRFAPPPSAARRRQPTAPVNPRHEPQGIAGRGPLTGSISPSLCQILARRDGSSRLAQPGVHGARREQPRDGAPGGRPRPACASSPGPHLCTHCVASGCPSAAVRRAYGRLAGGAGLEWAFGSRLDAHLWCGHTLQTLATTGAHLASLLTDVPCLRFMPTQRDEDVPGLARGGVGG